MSFLKLNGISKKFGPVTALDTVEFEVEQDELLVILGPTGAGKTTLLRTIAGLEKPDTGSVFMDGEDVTHIPPSKRDTALVFQNFSLYPGMTVQQNLEFPLKAPGRKMPPDEIRERVASAAGILHIHDLLRRDVSNLSGGQMQRVAIGRAIVRRPRIFLMDEPLTNLDAKLREALRIELVCLRRELRVPMIFVTHDQTEALSMADRIAVLSQGNILQIDIPEAIYRRPVSPVVARQLGQPRINIFTAALEGDLWTIQGREMMKVQTLREDAAVIGVRPEDILLEGGTQQAEIRMVEDMGVYKVLLASWLDQDIHIIVPPSFEGKPGDIIHPKIEENKAVIWGREVSRSDRE